MNKLENQNDWWSYLAHGQDGSWANHKYYARVAVGTSGGHVQYRYFYSKDEYGAYQKNKAGTRKTYAEMEKSNDFAPRSTKTDDALTAKEPSEWRKRRQEQADREARIRTGNKRLTGKIGSEKHWNGRTVYYAEEQYRGENGKLSARKKFIDRDTYDQMQLTNRRRERATTETEKEKQARTKAARKRYDKKMSGTRRKRAIQKGMQTVLRLLNGKK
nr:MAG TPA: hypothetical protein [Caudoviricetes sp.]